MAPGGDDPHARPTACASSSRRCPSCTAPTSPSGLAWAPASRRPGQRHQPLPRAHDLPGHAAGSERPRGEPRLRAPGRVAVRLDAGRPRHLLPVPAARVAGRGLRALRRGPLAAGLPRHRHRARHRPRGDPRGPGRRGAAGRRRQPLARAHLPRPPARLHHHRAREAHVRSFDEATLRRWHAAALRRGQRRARVLGRGRRGRGDAHGRARLRRAPTGRAHRGRAAAATPQKKPRLQIVENVSSQTELRVCLRAFSASTTRCGPRSTC